MGNSLHPISACSDALSTFLKGQIPVLTILQEWPYANQQLQYPSLTITRANIKRMPWTPYQVSSSFVSSSSSVLANLAVADWDSLFQLDLWCKNKLDRDQYLENILAAFEAQESDTTGNNNPDGISLQLTGYFNEWARFEIDRVESVDDEGAAQRQERRARIMVLVNVREIRQRTYYAMKTVQMQSNVTDSELDFDNGSPEIYNIPSS